MLGIASQSASGPIVGMYPRGVEVSAVGEWVPGLSWSQLPEGPVVALPAPMHGFPRAAGPVREWVPGVSTPDGLLLGAAGVVLVSAHPLLMERLVSGAVTSAMVLVGAAVPGSAVWLGLNLGQGG